MAMMYIVRVAAMVGALSSATAASAQSTNAPPIIVENATAIDASKLPMTDDGKKAITDVSAQIKAGSMLGAVFSGSMDGRFWAGAYWVSGTPQSASDLARQSLERCEYVAKAPCSILMVNGHEARSPDGSWPVQPRMIREDIGSKMDTFTIPFVPPAYRPALASYVSSGGPKALVLTTTGDYYWATGKKIFEAIDGALASCAKVNDPAFCLLFAVNDTVVLAP